MAVVDLSSPNWYTQVRVWLGNADETQEHYYELRGGGVLQLGGFMGQDLPQLSPPQLSSG